MRRIWRHPLLRADCAVAEKWRFRSVDRVTVEVNFRAGPDGGTFPVSRLMGSKFTGTPQLGRLPRSLVGWASPCTSGRQSERDSGGHIQWVGRYLTKLT